MKKWLLLSVIWGAMPLTMMAQDDDDMYFVPAKEKVAKSTVTYSAPGSTYYSGSNRDVDEYNRRGSYYEPVQGDSLSDIIDFSAVAKGFGVDHVANLFRNMGIRNFMVEIGGEIVAEGSNPKGEAWRIGINKPDDDSTGTNNELQEIIEVHNGALATSGNYRNFYMEGGRKIAHTIDPKTGYPAQQSILSSTVKAPSCAMADGYATAFMVMGMERAQEFLRDHPQLQAYFIYADEKGQYQTWHTPFFYETEYNK